ncbi:MAG: NADH-quinone oxidoreductase subunit C [Paludibacteraceae bacterium]
MSESSTLIEELQNKFGKKIESVDVNSDIDTLVINSESVKEIVRYLKENKGFNFLTDICGIHYPEQEKELGIVYHLHNWTENKRLRLKTFVTEANPTVESLVALFLAANWMERETYDFYGINFTDHPNLKRILNVEFMDYFPMRKEYPLEDATRNDKDDRYFGR